MLNNNTILNKMNNNYLPDDLMKMILNMRSEEMKKDKQIKDNKFNYSVVVSDIEFIHELTKEIFYEEDHIEDPNDAEGYTFSKAMGEATYEYNDLYKKDMKDTECFGMWVNNRYELEYYSH